MSGHPAHKIARRALRILTGTTLVTLLAAPLVTAPALAEAPENWPAPPSVSPLHALLLLGGVPLLLFVLITLLVYAPSLARGEGYSPGQAWRGEQEWFGGPRAGLDAAESNELEVGKGDERGGASARW